METLFRRVQGRSYMVTRSDQIDENRYEYEMLRRNRITGFLSMECKRMNGGVELWYDISGMQSLVQIYRKKTISGQELERLLDDLRTVFRETDRYLLDSAGILLNPEHILIDRSDGSARFCYFPAGVNAPCEVPEDEEDENAGQNPEEELAYGLRENRESICLPLAEFLLKTLDHTDHRAMSLAYSFYEGVQDQKRTIQQLVERILTDETAMFHRPAMEHGTESKSADGENVSKGAYRILPEEQGKDVKAGESYRGKFGARGDLDKAAPERTMHDMWMTDPGKLKQKDTSKKERSKHLEKNRKTSFEKRESSENEIRSRFLLFFVTAILFAAGINVFFDWYFHFDLTQIGGLAFLSIALLWLLYIVLTGRQEDQNPWEGYLPDEEVLEDEQVAPFAQTNTEQGARYRMEEEKSAPAADPNEEDMTRILTQEHLEEGVMLIGEKEGIASIHISEGQWVLGKSARHADICIPSDTVSRVHAQAELSSGVFRLMDLNSRNGTYVNGEMLEPNHAARLRSGDRVRFADCGYVVAV